LLLQAPQTPAPFIVKLVEPEKSSTWQRLAGILLGSLGVTGVIVLAAVVAGTIFAAVLFWLRSRSM
jgi:hypothetical protein